MPSACHPPESATRAAQDGIRRILLSPNASASVLASAAKGGVRMAAPHEVFNLGLSDLAEGRVSGAARFTGWRFVVLDQDSPIATVEVNPRPGNTFGFGALAKGPAVDATVRAMEVAEQDETPGGEYELRFLRVPALHVASLWLHAPDGDRFIPLPSQSPLAPFVPCDEREMLAVLQPLAQRRMAEEEKLKAAAAAIEDTPAGPTVGEPVLPLITASRAEPPPAEAAPAARPKKKRRWGNFPAASAFLTILVLVGAGVLTNVYGENRRLRESLRQAQQGPDSLNLSETQLVQRLLPVLTEGDEQKKAGAIRSLSESSPALAALVTALKPTPGTVSGLQEVRAAVSAADRSSIDSTLQRLPPPLRSVGPGISPVLRPDTSRVDSSQAGTREVGYWADPYGQETAGGQCGDGNCARMRPITADSARPTTRGLYGVWRDANGALWATGPCQAGQLCASIEVIDP